MKKSHRRNAKGDLLFWWKKFFSKMWYIFIFLYTNMVSWGSIVLLVLMAKKRNNEVDHMKHPGIEKDRKFE